MIKNLTEETDKMGMISLIKQINERISYFFANESNETSNILNINGDWGSGKSTIINNLEKYYDNNHTISKINWVIINLWEYETSSEPYFDLIDDIATRIAYLTESTDENKAEKVKEFRKWSFSLRIKYKDWEVGGKFQSSKTINKTVKEIINELIWQLNEIVANNKVIIIFDELDRCLHNNQIKFLSYIKNIFLKIKNIFYIVASNNELINSHLNSDKNPYSENYTDKIFEMKIDLKNIFLAENNNFTENKYIKEFQDHIGENNARLMTKLLKQVEKNIMYLKK